ncbi:hypothetical protein [Lysobacter silvisoli]|uniref:hypothetical protein n=1 Tax=Lysobacter silvisoli TaxID=2293254 RepID=UPI0013140A30|nr:hypothetical protein [Lysobacter silvisoli]
MQVLQPQQRAAVGGGRGVDEQGRDCTDPSHLLKPVPRDGGTPGPTPPASTALSAR